MTTAEGRGIADELGILVERICELTDDSRLIGEASDLISILTNARDTLTAARRDAVERETNRGKSQRQIADDASEYGRGITNVRVHQIQQQLQRAGKRSAAGDPSD